MSYDFASDALYHCIFGSCPSNRGLRLHRQKHNFSHSQNIPTHTRIHTHTSMMPVDRVGTWPSMCPHPRVPWRWVVVAAGCLTFTVLFGFLDSYNVLFVALQEEFDSSATMTGWIGSVSIGLCMLIAPLVNVLTERFGYRPVSVAGIVTSAGALIVTSFLPNILAVFLSYGVMVGIGGGLVTVSSIDVVMLYFPEQNSVRAMAMIMVGPGLGVVTLAPLMSLIITRHGWRVLLRIMGSLLFLVGLPCVLTFAEPPNSNHQPDDDKNKYQDLQPVTDALENAKNCTCKEAQVYHCDKAADWTPNVGSLTKLGNNNLVEEKKTYHQAKKSSDHRKGSCAKCTTLNDKQGYPRSFDREMPCEGDPCLNGESRCDVVKHCEKLQPQKGKCSDHGMVWKILVALTFPELWLLSISTVLNGIGDSFYFVNLINYMLSVGFQKEFGVKVVTVLGFANLVGRIMMSLGGDYVPFPRVFLLAISSLVGVGVMLLIMFTRNHIIMYIIAAGWIGAISIGLSLLVAPLVNILIERFGCRPVAIIGTIVAASALLVTSFLKNLLAVFIVYGLVFGVGGGLVTVCCFDAVLLYFPEENSVRAMGFLLTGTSFGLLSFTPLMSFIISRYGWRVLLRIVGPLLLFVGLPCVLTFVEPSHPSGDRNHRNGHKNIIYLRNEEEIAEISKLMDDSRMLNNSPKPLSVNEKSQCSQSGDERRNARVPVKSTRMSNGYLHINDKDTTASRGRFPNGLEDDPAGSGDPYKNGELRTEDKTRHVRTTSDQSMTRKILVALTFPELWLISISTILNGIGDCFYLVNWINYMISVGFPEPIGVRVVSLLGFSNLVGKIGLSVFGEYIPFPRVFLLVISSVVSIAVMLVIMFTRNVIIMYCIAVVVGGVTMTTTNTITFSLSSEFFGPERALETSGVILFTYGVGYVLGSLVGQSIDTTGSYTYAIWSFIGMYTISGLCVLMAPVYQRFFAPQRFVTFELYRKKMEARKKGVASEQKSSDCEENSLKSITIVCDRVTCV